MKTLLAIAALSLSSVAVAAPRPAPMSAPSRASILKATSARLNGASMKGAEVKFSGNGEATVLTKQFAGGPIMQGKSDMKMLPIADVAFKGNKITSVQPVDRGPVAL